MNFLQNEDTNGIRWSWNVFPNSKEEESRFIVPLGCLYTPKKEIKTMPTLPYAPIQCRSCSAILNPYCPVDFIGKFWSCPFCYQRNQFPESYYGISKVSLPAELIEQFTTVEYTIPQQQQQQQQQQIKEQKDDIKKSPVFLFLIDIHATQHELDSIKETILQSLAFLPPQSRIGLITLGTAIHVYDLSFAECPKSFILRGTNDHTFEKLQDLLQLRNPIFSQQEEQEQEFPIGIDKFFRPISECEFLLSEIFEDMQKDPWNTRTGIRPQRCVGGGLQVALLLFARLFNLKKLNWDNVDEINPTNCLGGRIITFLSGPCTKGKGQVVDRELTNRIRSHHDLQKGTTKYTKEAFNFYDNLGEVACKLGISIDLFGCSFDQVGCYEMKTLISKTGGDLLITDKFNSEIFINSLLYLFSQKKTTQQSKEQEQEKEQEKENENILLNTEFNASIEVNVSAELQILGTIANCNNLPKTKSARINEEFSIGNGKTNRWKLNTLDSRTTLGFYFSVIKNEKNPVDPKRVGIIQFKTISYDSDGNIKIRVTTSGHKFSDFASNPNIIKQSFDQEAAAVLVSRLAVMRTKTEKIGTILRWLDKSLIQVCQKFANFNKNNISSFQLSPYFSYYPQFMFHFRRSHFMNIFGDSPDESTYFSHSLYKENISNSILMFQPVLHSFTMNGPPKPVLLEMDSIQKDNILLLDSFFLVLIHHGKQIKNWIKQGYHEMEEYKDFATFLEFPKQEAKTLMSSRFPYPRFIECDQGSSPARFLLSRLNPSSRKGSNNLYSNNQNENSDLTDDVSFNDFMNHLKKVVIDLD
ncbi:protein transport protein sec23 [Anaeramoeba flamelloides]|uniref:Protein transport protein SEC23 n=1 Tax=Anaeramoeba flamelloides TaxID=1746091 RepID=A0AAV8ACZ4_9EUKA|nr:protein transport protein sec23 [Anaeramoeba flamelloides]